MKFLIVDDHAMIRVAIALFLREIAGEAEIDEAGGVGEALAKAYRDDYDLIILDLSLPDGSGLEVLEAVKKKSPHLPVIVISTHQDDEYALKAFALGAEGYLCKGCAPSEFMRVVRTIISGGMYISDRHLPAVVAGLRKPALCEASTTLPTPLSRRERDVAKLLVAGETNKEIAWKLELNTKTVSTYKMRILKKLQVKNQVELVKYALANDWLT